MDDVILENLNLVKNQREELGETDDRERLREEEWVHDMNPDAPTVKGVEEAAVVEAPNTEYGEVEEKGNSEEEVLGRSGRKSRTRSTKSSKRVVKRRRRPRVDSRKFRLHDFSARTAVNNTKHPTVRARVVESLCICEIMLTGMHEVWVENPFLRCVHMKHKGRRMDSVASARMNFMLTGGKRKEVRTIDLTMECAHKEIANVNAIQSRSFSAAGSRERSSETLSCSCTVRREYGVIV